MFISEWLALIVSGIAAGTDLKWRRIPHFLTIPSIVTAVVFHFREGLSVWELVWGIVPAAILYLIAVATHGRGLGGGDIMLVLLIGIAVGGIFTWVCLLLAFLFGAIVLVGTFLIFQKQITEYPLAPFLFLGLLCSQLLQHGLQ